jgi:hypothetical protein
MGLPVLLFFDLQPVIKFSLFGERQAGDFPKRILTVPEIPDS